MNSCHSKLPIPPYLPPPSSISHSIQCLSCTSCLHLLILRTRHSSSSFISNALQQQHFTFQPKSRFWHPQKANTLKPSSVAMDLQHGSLRDGGDAEKHKGWVHFVGIGGYGLSALALLALKTGWSVSGSDCAWTHRLDSLQEAGIRVYNGHSAGNILRACSGEVPDVVVTSSAIPKGNAEVEAAKMHGVKIFNRAAWLKEVTKGYELIAVAGTHGKSTTTAMLSFTLHTMGDDLTAVIGADVPQFPGGRNAIVGSGARFVLEADEYDHCFLSTYPSLAVVTNVEWEHVDIYPDKDSVYDAFTKFVLQIKPGGVLILCGDNDGSRSLASNFIEDDFHEMGVTENKCLLLQQRRLSKLLTYGLTEGNQWRAISLSCNACGGTDYTAVYNGVPMARVSLKSPGIHNVLNSLAVIAVASVLAIKDKQVADGSSELETIKDSALAVSKCLETFVGVQRRFQFIGAAKGCCIYDDYAHHPTEVRAVLQGARQNFAQQQIWVVFEPHTYSRLASMLQDFAMAFGEADRVIVSKVYSARVENHEKVSGADLASMITCCHAVYIPELDDIIKHLLGELTHVSTSASKQSIIVILSIGAGDVTTIGPKLMEALTP